MTWRTSRGDRKLDEKEGKLFIHAVRCLCDTAVDGEGKLNDGYPVIQGAFQRLTEPRKCSVLLEVSKHLLEDTPTMPELTAVNESAVWYVYRWLQLQFDDVECAEEVCGEQIIAALHETGLVDEQEDPEEDPDLPTMGCMDRNRWEYALEFLSDRILWDSDWEQEGLFASMGDRCSEGYFKPYRKRARDGALEALKQYASLHLAGP